MSEIHTTAASIAQHPARRYIVMSSSAQMPSSCWGIYRRCAILEIVPGATPDAIDERRAGVVRVVETWERLHYVAGSDRCAFAVALQEAIEACARLNGDDPSLDMRTCDAARAALAAGHPEVIEDLTEGAA